VYAVGLALFRLHELAAIARQSAVRGEQHSNCEIRVGVVLTCNRKADFAAWAKIAWCQGVGHVIRSPGVSRDHVVASAGRLC